MHRNNMLLYMPMLTWIFSSCIRSYDPDILAEDEKKYVITGQVTDEDGPQTIHVSISSPIDIPMNIPVTNCKVKIIDDQGHIFPLSGHNNGDYSNTIDATYLQPGRAFQVEVFTHEGDYILSDFDTLTHGSEVDSVYYIRETKQYNPAYPYVQGIRFYLDVDAAPTDNRYFRWDVIETYEYRTIYPIEWYYDGDIHHVTPPDSSRMICWKTIRQPDIYTLTTDPLVENKYTQYPLHFVHNLTVKLFYGYSLLVRQYALSQAAFLYYENLRVNSNPDGGLYEKQPLAIRGNLHNMTHPEKEVLGFFSACAVRSKRIFVYPIPDLPAFNDVYCDPGPIPPGGLDKILPKFYPVYLKANATGYSPIWLENTCVDCLVLGGSNIKPDFWPN